MSPASYQSCGVNFSAEEPRWLEALESLGLKALEARILVAVMDAEEITSAALRSVTGSSAQSIAAAVDALIKRQLLDRATRQRPQLVFVHPNAMESLQALRAAELEARQNRESELDLLGAAIELAARRRVERGLPPGASPDHVPSPRGRTSHDEVVGARELGNGTASRSWLCCPSRILVTDSGPVFDLVELGGRQQPGSEVRLSREPLPPLRLLDGNRLATMGSTPVGRATVWSHDARHVRAAQELFELWWARAAPGVTKPHPPKQPEPEWDVEEWDPADL